MSENKTNEGESVVLSDLNLSTSDRIGICYGTFDTIHPGHINYFKYAKTHCEKIIVFLNQDATALYSLKDRVSNLNSCNFVDYVLPVNERTFLSYLDKLKPVCLVLGEEFKTKRSGEISKYIHEMETRNVEIKYYKGSFFPSLLRENIDTAHVDDNINVGRLKQSMTDKRVDKEELIKILELFDNTKIGVLGDVVVDRYIEGNVLGISSEAPVMVFHELDVMDFVGGAGVVAAHCAELGGEVDFFTVVGSDNEGEWVQNELNKYNINAKLVVDPNRPTTLKTRFISEQQKLFRSSRLSNTKLNHSVHSKFEDYLKEVLPELSRVIISDFSYGMVDSDLISFIKDKKNIPNA